MATAVRIDVPPSVRAATMPESSGTPIRVTATVAVTDATVWLASSASTPYVPM